ncbi:glycosyltransferase [Methylophaga sp.]|uniref:glycosyltransferase n=1 Tax=Methylophaga sp. TaxID=2024840 RepID=UPI003F6A1684
MKIAQVLSSQGNGGLEKHVRELSIAIHERGHDITVIADPLFNNTLPSQIKTIAIPCHLSRHDPRLLWRLGRALRIGQYDITHAQANKAAIMLNTLRPIYSGRRVATLHNIKRQLKAFKHFDQVITVSKQLALPFAADKVTVVYNGTELPSSALLASKNHTPATLLAVGRLVKAKGFDVLIKAVADLPVTLLIAGDGPDKTKLQSLIDNNATAANIQLLGTRQDVFQLMQQADGLIIASRREGFSYVLNEALLSHCPVLATNVPVANEVLPDGLIVPIDNPLALQERLQTLLAERDAWSALMQKPYEFARQQMTLTAMTQQTLSVYEKLISA